MTTRERMDLYYFALTPETPFCINCKHYYQHYRKDGRPFPSGHCVYPRMKPRRDYDTCGNFERRD